MLSFEKASNEGRHQTISTQVDRPAPLAEGEFESETADLTRV
jgi:hypothetical protein